MPAPLAERRVRAALLLLALHASARVDVAAAHGTGSRSAFMAVACGKGEATKFRRRNPKSPIEFELLSEEMRATWGLPDGALHEP